MKSFITNPSRRFALFCLLGALLPGNPVKAQNFTALHNFTSGGDAANPWSGLLLHQNQLFGTAYSGGLYQSGTIYMVNTDGTGFTNLYQFTGADDGANPYGGLLLSGTTFYGTTSYDGVSGSGTVFKLNIDGSGFTPLHGFTGGSDGGKPWSGVVLSGSTLYGTGQIGGSGGQGVVYAINTDGTGFRIVHNFTGINDGSSPYAPVLLVGNVLYGTTLNGGTGGSGTLYSVNTDGSGFTNLYSFSATVPPELSNSDGAGPWGGLLLIGDTLVGTASGGGASGNGTIFSINTNGSGFKVLHTFSGFNASLANTDGASPSDRLILSGQNLYGTAETGGAYGSGTVFLMNTNGTGFKTLYDFSASAGLNAPNIDGAYPVASVLLAGNALYGTAYAGGTGGYGSVFSLSLASAGPPTLTITPSGANVVLAWSTNSAGFTLESTTNLNSPVWSAVSPGPVVVNGQNIVTNAISGSQQYFRLTQ